MHLWVLSLFFFVGILCSLDYRCRLDCLESAQPYVMSASAALLGVAALLLQVIILKII
jgi:hypothetical protein